MKKIIAAIAALSLSAFMLTGCNKDPEPTGDSAMTESITASEAAGADNASAEDSGDSSDSNDAGAAAPEITETEAETTEAEPEEDLSDAVAVYASLEEFAKADDIFSHPGETIDAEGSYTYAFLKSLEGGTGFYLNMEAIDKSMGIIMALESDRISMIINGNFLGSDEMSNMAIIIADGKMYMLDIAAKSGFSMDLDPEEFAEMFAEYDPEEILSEINIDTDSELGNITRYKVAIGGKAYYFEFDSNDSKTGMLYDSTGKVAAVIGTDTADAGMDLSAMIINDFTSDIPADAFDVPTGYEIFDFSEFANLDINLE